MIFGLIVRLTTWLCGWVPVRIRRSTTYDLGRRVLYAVSTYQKQKAIKTFATRFGLNVYVETGIYFGHILEEVKDSFREVYSVELDDWLFENARRKFAPSKHVHIVHGDSGEILPRLVAEITEPCLFFLDAHYCAGISARGQRITPIMEELRCILSHPVKGHVILVDDAKFFNGQWEGYPHLDEVTALVQQHQPGSLVEVSDDVIRIYGEPIRSPVA